LTEVFYDQDAAIIAWKALVLLYCEGDIAEALAISDQIDQWTEVRQRRIQV